jgi:hypothetical protein
MKRHSTRTYRSPFSLAERVPISPLAHRSLSIRLAKATFFNLLFWLTLIVTLTACLAVCNS